MMQMSRASARSCNGDMQSAAFQPNGEVAGHNAYYDFNQRDRDSDSDRDQTGDERQAHPDRSDKPNIFEHKKLLPAWKESLAHAVFLASARKANSIALARF